MLKMFNTQLTGLFKRILDKEEESIEDSARLLAQAIVGDGTIYLYGQQELYGVVSEAIHGLEALPSAKEWKLDVEQPFSSSDRFILFSRTNEDSVMNQFAQMLYDKEIPFVAISSITNKEIEGANTLADIHIDLKVTKGLLPDDEGNRYGFPSLIAALFIYHGIKFTMDEIVKEYEESL